MRGMEATSSRVHDGGNPAGCPSFDDEDDPRQPQQPDRPQDHLPGGWTSRGGADKASGMWGGSVSLPHLGSPVQGSDKAAVGKAPANGGLGGEEKIIDSNLCWRVVQSPGAICTVHYFGGLLWFDVRGNFFRDFQVRIRGVVLQYTGGFISAH